ncbi:MAG: glutamine--fructose-6-phosphate transaminase (isomerizing) [Firmicutes bacterium]|nr:glutamine--fructose-6-phosphate transaminase (isomerizing) [Candidatus Fermentithermobacillaceae bacterium]
MCGIVGYVGTKEAASVVFDSLCRLEYRGYDSAGIAVLDSSGIKTVKRKGRLAELSPLVKTLPRAPQAIGHTRWATHGAPSDLNSHPHSDCTGDIVLVHNGIIENHRELREKLVSRGHVMRTEVDTEVVAHLIEDRYRGDLAAAVAEAVRELEGAMALAVIHRNEPGKIVAYREKSPLIIGLGDGENFLASDIPAILPYTRKILALSDGEMAVITEDEVIVYSLQSGLNADGRPLTAEDRKPMVIDLEAEAAEKGGFDHFMLKEIFEQPEALSKVVSGRIRDGLVKFEKGEFGLSDSDVRSLSKVYLLGCGTAYHACLMGKYLIERLAGIPAEAVLASELRYMEPIVPERTLVIAVSQSGETLDTLAAVREAKERGAWRTLAVVNQPLSSLTREVDDVLYQRAGPEISVCSTKAYTTQVVCLAMVACHMGTVRGRLSEERARAFGQELKGLADKALGALESSGEMERLAAEMAKKEDIFFIGRGADYLAVMEGQLKLKEISYIHAEAYAAGELKHGTLALIAPGVPVVASLMDPAIAPKTASNIMEVKARGGWVVAIGSQECLERLQLGERDVTVPVPSVNPLISPVVSVIAMQLLAYYVARELGTDIDKPRNLAKSVTVE